MPMRQIIIKRLRTDFVYHFSKKYKMKKILFIFLCTILTTQLTAQLLKKERRLPVISPGISAAIIQSYNWWRYINPTNVNLLSSFTNINPANYDTGIVNYSKRTAMSLVGWFNPNISLSDATANDSLIHLEPLVYLEQLLVGSNIGDAGIVHIRVLKNLKHFEITVSGTPVSNVTDKGMSILGNLTKLEVLRLYFCSNVSDLGLEYLSTLTDLKELTLNGCGITDKGLSTLSAFTKLQTLGLAATHITDNGVEMLIQLLPSLPALTKIIISNSQISVKGRDALIASRRGLSVIY